MAGIKKRSWRAEFGQLYSAHQFADDFKVEGGTFFISMRRSYQSLRFSKNS